MSRFPQWLPTVLTTTSGECSARFASTDDRYLYLILPETSADKVHIQRDHAPAQRRAAIQPTPTDNPTQNRLQLTDYLSFFIPFFERTNDTPSMPPLSFPTYRPARSTRLAL